MTDHSNVHRAFHESSDISTPERVRLGSTGARAYCTKHDKINNKTKRESSS